MITFADSELREFNIAICEAKSAISFIQLASWLRPRLNDFINWEILNGEPKDRTREFLECKNLELSSLYRGAMVMMCGAFEQAIRRITEASINKIRENCSAFDEIPKNIRSQNIYRSGRLLATYFSPLDHISTNYELIANNLATCKSGSTSFTINAEAFSHSISQITPKQISDIFSWIGSDLNWDEFGKNAKFQKFFNLTKTRETANKIQEHLTSFVSTRNKLAHGGVGGASIDIVAIENYAEFLAIFVEDFISVMSTKITLLTK